MDAFITLHPKINVIFFFHNISIVRGSYLILGQCAFP